ncbi:hypothetical protein GJ744_001545 [Endocarpon pusillum]|uniref:Uncharacterized protein n=1 Tax=Endocarpon pusillum TaxID=364733 RepID=A0A8H7ACH7_9EURO|nr:hypothetical protein GJ744_001545 [Endocarpon pusillum]
MGDAGPPLSSFGEDVPRQRREVTVFVTGFGPFKTFTHNPSHLITALLPAIILPDPKSLSSQPTPMIHLLTHPHPSESPTPPSPAPFPS